MYDCTLSNVIKYNSQTDTLNNTSHFHRRMSIFLQSGAVNYRKHTINRKSTENRHHSTACGVWLTGAVSEVQRKNIPAISAQFKQQVTKHNFRISSLTASIPLNCKCCKKKWSPTRQNWRLMTDDKQLSETCNILSTIKVLRVIEQICVQMLQKPAQALGYKPAVEHSLTWQDPTKGQHETHYSNQQESPSSRTHLALVVSLWCWRCLSVGSYLRSLKKCCARLTLS